MTSLIILNKTNKTLNFIGQTLFAFMRTGANQCRRTTVISLFILAASYQTTAYAQTSPSDVNARITPIIVSLLLNEDEEQCPAVSSATTIMGDFVISTQQDLDDLADVTRLEGNLLVSSTLSSLDFSPLDSLSEIMGHLGFDGTQLTGIAGFDCLTTVGGDLIFADNDQLTSTPEFSALVSVGDLFEISNNGNLITLSGFSSLTHIGGVIDIFSSLPLKNIPEFPALVSVGGLIIFSTGLTKIGGFNSLMTVTDSILVSSNFELTDFSGFSSLSNIGDSYGRSITISIHFRLTSVPEFTSLTSISGSIKISSNFEFDCGTASPFFRAVDVSFQNLVDCPLALTTEVITPSVNAIPDATGSSLSSNVTIADQVGTFDSLSVDLDITHTFVADLEVTLSNGSTTITLLSAATNTAGDTCSGDDIDVNLSDTPITLTSINESCNAGTSGSAFTELRYRPLEPLSDFSNSSANATWTLRLLDTTSGEAGTLNSWSLNFIRERFGAE